MKTIGDFDVRWSALLSPRGGGVHADIVWKVTIFGEFCAY